MKISSYSFPLLDLEGTTQPAKGMLGSFGFSDIYRGNTGADDELIIAIRASERDERQTKLIRSFAFAWLTGREKKLGLVVAQSVELPPSVHYLNRIGMIDRTTGVIVSGSAVVAAMAGSFLFLDGVWDLLPTADAEFNPMAWLAADTAVFVIPEVIFGKVRDEFGEFGSPIPRKDFNPDVVFNFLQLCHFHDLLRTDQGPVSHRLEQVLHQRIFAMFVSISRQSEGLMLSGQSEAIAALGGQTAIALGLHQIQSHEEILAMIQRGVKSVQSDNVAKQIDATLASVRENMKVEVGQVQRELDRQLLSSMATEATDLAAQPVKLTLDLLSSMAGGLAYLAPDPSSSKLVSLVKTGLAQTSTAVDATPDMISKMLQGGIATESWVRNLVRVPWRKSSK